MKYLIERNTLSDLVNEFCGICDESLFFQNFDPIQTECGHMYHYDCLESWCNKTGALRCKCPHCRHIFSFKDDNLFFFDESLKTKIKNVTENEINDIIFDAKYTQDDINEILAKIRKLRDKSLVSVSSHKSRSNSKKSNTESIQKTRRRRMTRFNKFVKVKGDKRYTEAGVNSFNNNLLEQMSDFFHSNERFVFTNKQKQTFMDTVFVLNQKKKEYNVKKEDYEDIIENPSSWVRNTIRDLKNKEIVNYLDLLQVKNAFDAIKQSLIWEEVYLFFYPGKKEKLTRKQMREGVQPKKELYLNSYKYTPNATQEHRENVEYLIERNMIGNYISENII